MALGDDADTLPGAGMQGFIIGILISALFSTLEGTVATAMSVPVRFCSVT